ncbi:MAG: copper transport protein [Solirubrobacteraceae bacterium]|jgi:copper transport protein|nr:copper transport protein [Solirubrobacteraceae bacterium]
MRAARRLALAALCAAGLSGALAPAAFGHAAFAGASPPPGQRVEDSPARVVLSFTEPLRRELSEATLADAAGQRAPAAMTVRGREIVLTPDRTLARGAYRVRWRTVSTQDGHPLEGSYGFGVRAAPTAGAGSLQESPLAGGGWVRAAVRGLLYAALLLFAGGLLTRALLGPRWRAGAGAARRADAVVADSGLAAAALAAVSAVVDTADAAGGLSLDALRSYLLSGTPGLARVALVALVGIAIVLARRAPRAAALAAVAALGCVVASGHANSADPRALAILADWAHLVAGAVWLGGAALIVAAWGPELRRSETRGAVVRDVLPTFGRVALPAFGAVVAAGTVNALVELGSVSNLWDTAYGRVLLAKVLLVVAAATAAWTHALRGRPAWRALRAEVALGAGIVMIAGLLVAFPLPPRQLESARGGGAGLPACDPCPLPAPRRDELSVAGQAGSQVVAAWIRRAPGGLTGTIRTLDSQGRPGTGRIAVPAGRARPCGTGCATFAAPPSPVLRVSAQERDRAYAATLPATWRAQDDGQARRLLDRAQATMRSLRSVREDEEVSSGPGQRAFTRYALRAPDRLAFATGGGVQTVQIDRTQWLRTPGSPWRRSPVPGGVPFRTRSWFRWTPYARSIHVLARRGPLAELALADPATPVWLRLTVDTRTGRVLRERLVARARFIDRRFSEFDAPVRIVPPRGAVVAG